MGARCDLVREHARKSGVFASPEFDRGLLRFELELKQLVHDALLACAFEVAPRGSLVVQRERGSRRSHERGGAPPRIGRAFGEQRPAVESDLMICQLSGQPRDLLIQFEHVAG